ncbi:MAG: signal peptidase I [Treponema sp.]|nr:signal peptidase I [Treponema sp.]
MAKRGRTFSYASHKTQRRRVYWIFAGVIIFFLLNSAVSYFFTMRVLRNQSMEPNLLWGDHFIFSSYQIYSLVPGLSPDASLPLQRGNVVLLDLYPGDPPGPVLSLADRLLRFFSAQRLSLVDRDEFHFVKRVIGLPGDEITMNNFVIRVRERGSAFSLTEFELSVQDYTPGIPQNPALWDSYLPFSGYFDPIVLGEDEYFLLSDDRSNTNDSRTWGPVPSSAIQGRALFRYWPLRRMGRP